MKGNNREHLLYGLSIPLTELQIMHAAYGNAPFPWDYDKTDKWNWVLCICPAQMSVSQHREAKERGSTAPPFMSRLTTLQTV